MTFLSRLLTLIPASATPQPLEQGLRSSTWVPPGHFYSPIVDVDLLAKQQSRVFNRNVAPSDIDFRDRQQLDLLRELSQQYNRLPFLPTKIESLRYYYENPAFSYADAITLSCMMMNFRPKRVIEIGSGFSSCVLMDINDLFLERSVDISFIEPYPELLLSLMKERDKTAYSVIASPVQDIDLAIIDNLMPGDFLFIDSTHVSKAGSDVNFEFFDVLPRVRPGVFIHFHDIFYPFEYPEAWFFEENRSWNELYLLRAFLSGNNGYEITFFNDYMFRHHRDEIETLMPLFLRNSGGSFWMRKL